MSDLYDRGFYAWTREQAGLLREGRLPGASAYRRARLHAEQQTGLPAGTFPAECPWTFDQAMADAPGPEAVRCLGSPRNIYSYLRKNSLHRRPKKSINPA